MSVQSLLDEEAAAEEDDQTVYVFLADATTMKDPARSLLAVDLSDEPGAVHR